MAELFLQELDPKLLARPTGLEAGYDLLVGFPNSGGGINHVAVGVKATERPPGARFALPRGVFKQLAHLNIPSLLLVADVRQSQLYYGWVTPDHGRAGSSSSSDSSVSVPITPLDDKKKKKLKEQLQAANGKTADG